MGGFASEGYWVKSQLFLNRALESDAARSEGERRLWASVALEQLAKWALAKTSPTLIADSTKTDGDQLFRALGLREGGPYVSVTASTAFKRCAAIYRPFNEKDAISFTNAGNEYLHGTEVALLNLSAEAWWSRFWSLVNVLLAAHHQVFDELVPASRRAEIEGHLARNAKRLEHQCEVAIKAARRNLARYREGHMLADEARRWEQGGLYLGRGFLYESEVPCPACGDYGTAEGENARREDVVWSDDPDEVAAGVVIVTIAPEFFSCPTCHLVLESIELIEQAKLDEPLTIMANRSYVETEFGND
jgi:hypothetical protein